MTARSSRPSLSLLFCLTFGLVLLPACRPDGEEGAKKGKKDGEKTERDLVPVEVVALERGKIEALLRYSTNLEAESQVQVVSQAQRLVTELRAEEGQAVGRNQVLIRLQDDEQKSSIARIQSQLEKAQREYARQKSLFDQKLISEQVYNEARFQVDQLEIALRDAERDLGYTEVRAPISGVVTSRMVMLGDNIKVGQHLFDIVDFNSIVGRVFVPEREIPRLKLGQVARILSPSLGGDPRVGQILRIAPTVDPKSGTVKVTVKILANQGPANQILSPGMYVEVELVVDEKSDALLVPKRALVFDDTAIFVYRLKDDMTVERLAITAQLQDRDFIMPADGLAPGDKIVVAGQAGLKSGSKVRLAGQREVNDAKEAL
jgi:membrane fusion protein, multidrug efflux system